jgi:hypothetical protein
MGRNKTMTLVETVTFAAALTQILLIFVVLFRLGAARIAALKSGIVQMKNIAVNNDNWPESVLKLSNNFKNQFEMPVLFMLALGFDFMLFQGTWITATLACLFTLSRWVHMAIHTGGNNIMHRFYAYACGVACVAALWIWLGLKVFLI